jgi:hypothetical protein
VHHILWKFLDPKFSPVLSDGKKANQQSRCALDAVVLVRTVLAGTAGILGDLLEEKENRHTQKC